jgi:uncharacterized protein with von Willebrand factor type A (vWA) domain
MKTYDVTIRATIYKTIRVEAENEHDAYVEAHEVFSVMPDDSERYEEETMDIEEVEAA